MTDGTLSPEDKDSIEVANQCIGDAFKVEPSNKAAVADALGSGQNLLSIYSVYEKLRGKSTPSTSEGGSSAQEGRPATPQMGTNAGGPAGGKNAEAETLKSQGNTAMQQKRYQEAVELYGKALEITPTNPIYLSNRAAAYSALSQHELAKADAEMATASDPKYTKAWSRLGLARFALGDAKGSMEAYQNGIDAEGNGGSEAMRKGYETAKKKVEGAADAGSPERSRSPPSAGGGGGGGGGMPDLGALAGMMGGGGGGGGMPDIGQMMQNPMMRQMAESVMSNPEMMQNFMNNPKLKEMFGGGGGGMPDIGALMSDPKMRDL